MARSLEVVSSLTPRRLPAPGPRLALAERYCHIRFATEALCDPLSPEDLSARASPEASPVKWHLGHVTWFFEHYVLKECWRDYSPYNRALDAVFGADAAADPRQHELAGRPSKELVQDYRRHVDAYVLALLCSDDGVDSDLEERLALALHHEQRHQERLIADVKQTLAQGPLRPAYLERPHARELLTTRKETPPMTWERYATTLAYIGSDSGGLPSSEQPRHQALVHGFELASRLVTCAEYQEFIADGGYYRPELWLADGWALVQKKELRAPLYWQADDTIFTLSGQEKRCGAEPVCHVSYYEADAYARYRQARLPSEQEWEVAAQSLEVAGNFAESGILHPMALADNDDAQGRRGPRQMFGDVWEWTTSAYASYPGERLRQDALGRRDERRMCNRLVLRGGSCASPRAMMRATHRHHLSPDARAHFSGIRLAR
jgi:ergothioneine biosynthesis protein EgtB